MFTNKLKLQIFFTPFFRCTDDYIGDYCQFYAGKFLKLVNVYPVHTEISIFQYESNWYGYHEIPSYDQSLMIIKTILYLSSDASFHYDLF